METQAPTIESSIYRKLHKIMDEVGYIQKDQKVEYGSTKYKAATERAVLNAIRPKLVENGLILLPVSGEVVPTQSAKGAYVTSLSVQYQLVDTESGERIHLWSTGQGHDSSDKGAGKAFTYATKYLLLKMFLIETGDDPDVTASDQNVDTTEAAELYEELVEMIDLALAAGKISEQGAERTKDRLKEARGNVGRLQTAKSRIEALS